MPRVAQTTHRTITPCTCPYVLLKHTSARQSYGCCQWQGSSNCLDLAFGY